MSDEKICPVMSMATFQLELCKEEKCAWWQTYTTAQPECAIKALTWLADVVNIK